MLYCEVVFFYLCCPKNNSMDIDYSFTYVDMYYDAFLYINPKYTDGQDGNTCLNEIFREEYETLLTRLPSKVSKESYDNHEQLQTQLEKLNLDKEAFWKLIVFLYFYVRGQLSIRVESTQSINEKVKFYEQFINDNINKGLSIILIGDNGERLTITDEIEIKKLLTLYNIPKEYSPTSYWEMTNRITRDEITTVNPDNVSSLKTGYFITNEILNLFNADMWQYERRLEFFKRIDEKLLTEEAIKNLRTYCFQIKSNRRRNAKISGTEKLLFLSIMNLLGYLNDNSLTEEDFYKDLIKTNKDKTFIKYQLNTLL